jgi:hypothetical protein
VTDLTIEQIQQAILADPRWPYGKPPAREGWVEVGRILDEIERLAYDEGRLSWSIWTDCGGWVVQVSCAGGCIGTLPGEAAMRMLYRLWFEEVG